MPEEIPVPEDALSGVLQKEENRRLYTAMNRLSPADRELLILALFRGLVHPADGRAAGYFGNGSENSTVPRQSQTETEIRR